MQGFNGLPGGWDPFGAGPLDPWSFLDPTGKSVDVESTLNPDGSITRQVIDPRTGQPIIEQTIPPTPADRPPQR